MLKQGDWYFIPVEKAFFKRNFLGSLNKVIKVSDNPNYCTIERWMVTSDRKYESMGIFEDTDSVDLTKFGKKVKPPSKVFQVLYSETVKEKTAIDQTIDTDIEYSDD